MMTEQCFYVAEHECTFSAENYRNEVFDIKTNLDKYKGTVLLSSKCHVMRVTPQDFSATFPAYVMPAYGCFATFSFPEMPLRMISGSTDVVNTATFVKGTCLMKYSVFSRIGDLESMHFFGEAKTKPLFKDEVEVI